MDKRDRLTRQCVNTFLSDEDFIESLVNNLMLDELLQNEADPKTFFIHTVKTTYIQQLTEARERVSKIRLASDKAWLEDKPE